MPAFDYQAVDSRGKNKKGVLEGDTAKQVRSMLREQGLMPIEVTASLAKAKAQKSSFGFGGGGKISATDLALITRQLATLVESGLPLEESLMAVAEQCDKPKQKSMIMAVRTKVTEGYALAESMAEFPQVFNNLFRSMVAAGEKSGHLDKVLNRLADYTEQRQEMNSEIKQALVYPISLMVIATLVVVILLTSVVPEIVAQFEHLGEGLPSTTQFLISASDFLRENGAYLAIAIALFILAVSRVLKVDKYRYMYDQNFLKLPGLGKVSLGVNTARFASTLSILSASAVPLLESMRIAGDVLDNQHMKAQIKEAGDKVREGATLRHSLEQTKLFPPMMLHMIASGEKSGELENMLGRAADNQEREFRALVKMSLSAFEPAIMIVMAGIVLFIVMAILEPTLQMNNMIG